MPPSTPRMKPKAYYPTELDCSIQDLPAELLVEIFLYVVASSLPENYSPRTLYAPHTPSYLSSASPFALSHVCQTWRAISIFSSQLWTSLRVVSPKSPKILPLLSLWVQRSGSHHLNLSLYQQPVWGGLAHRNEDKDLELKFDATRLIWQLFLTFIDRWFHLDVIICWSLKGLLVETEVPLRRDWSATLPLRTMNVAFGPFESPCPGQHWKTGLDTSTLQSPLAKTKHHPIFFDEPSFVTYLISYSPQLHRVKWDNRYLDSTFDLVANWPCSLTDVTLYGTQEIIPLLFGLSTCKSLRRLTIYEQTLSSHLIYHGNPNSSRRLTVPILHGLETLRLGIFPHAELLFSNLIVPDLRSLIILRGYNGRRGWRGLTRVAWFALSEMMSRSLLKNLSTLEIGGVVLDMSGRSDD